LRAAASIVWALMSDAAVKAFIAADRLSDAAAILHSERHFSGPAREPFLARARGRLTVAEGRPQEALEHLHGARTAFAERGETRQELWTMLSLATAYAACAQTEAAEGCLEDVIRVAGGSGLTLLERLARDEARRIGVTLEAASQPAIVHRPAAADAGVQKGDPTVVLTAHVAAPSPLATHIDEYLRWAGQHLEGHEATDVVSSSSDVRARFDSAGPGENAIAAAVRAALGLHAKASLAAVPLTVSLVGSTLSGDAAP